MTPMMMTTLLQAVVDIRGNLEKESPSTIFDLGKLVGGLAGVGLIVAGTSSFGFFVLGGVQWVMSAGDKGKIENAQRMITNSIVGLAITASAFAIFMIIQFLFGIDIVKT